MEQQNDYFKTYGDLQVHRTMLLDEVRIESYWNSIFSRNIIKEKVVLDVGAGTGILSVFCAKAGAKKVYAVEACSRLIPLMCSVVKDNRFDEVIEIIHGEVEKVVLNEKVDVLISEWMGHFLLHEGMLASIISARRLLKNDGIMIPKKANIYFALCDMPNIARKWSKVKDVDLSSVTNACRVDDVTTPIIDQVPTENIMSESKTFATFDMYSVSMDDLESQVLKSVLVGNKDGFVEGICIWWDVELREDILLSTSPWAPSTHWKQTVVLLPIPFAVEVGTPVCIELSMKKRSERLYAITVTLLDAEEEDHEIPCNCNFTRCVVTKAYLLKLDESQVSMDEVEKDESLNTGVDTDATETAEND